MKLTIYKVQNGYLLNISANGSTVSKIYTDKERMKMFVDMQDVMGEEPEGSVGMEGAEQ